MTTKRIAGIRFRIDMNVLVLQVLEERVGAWGQSTWRDATVEDMLEVAPFIRAHPVPR